MGPRSRARPIGGTREQPDHRFGRFARHHPRRAVARVPRGALPRAPAAPPRGERALHEVHVAAERHDHDPAGDPRRPRHRRITRRQRRRRTPRADGPRGHRRRDRVPRRPPRQRPRAQHLQRGLALRGVGRRSPRLQPLGRTTRSARCRNGSCSPPPSARAPTWTRRSPSSTGSPTNGFIGTFMPGFMRHRDMPPLFDPYWEPFFAACEAHGLALVVHAGFGFEQGVVYDGMARRRPGGRRERRRRHGPRACCSPDDVFTADFFSSVKGRRPMWQLMFGGVFDRHPNLKLVHERGARRLDARACSPTSTRSTTATATSSRPGAGPSEYWRSNCLAGASFMHKAEVEMRHEIGVEHDPLRARLPAPRGHLAEHPRLAARRVRRRARGRAATHARRERDPLLRSRTRAAGGDRRAHRTRGRRPHRTGRRRRRRAPRHLRRPRRLPGRGRRRVPAWRRSSR